MSLYHLFIIAFTDRRIKTLNLKVKIKVICFCYLAKAKKVLHLKESLKRNLKSLLPSTVKANIGFTGKKLTIYFQIKDQTKFEHKHDIVYLVTCPEDNCSDNYISESGRRISERIINHNGRDKKNCTFSSITLKNATKTFTLTVLNAKSQ